MRKTTHPGLLFPPNDVSQPCPARSEHQRWEQSPWRLQQLPGLPPSLGSMGRVLRELRGATHGVGRESFKEESFQLQKEFKVPIKIGTFLDQGSLDGCFGDLELMNLRAALTRGMNCPGMNFNLIATNTFLHPRGTHPKSVTTPAEHTLCIIIIIIIVNCIS